MTYALPQRDARRAAPLLAASLLVASLLVASLLVAMVGPGCRRGPELPPIPQPRFDRLDPLAAEQVTRARAAVAATPQEAEQNGRLGMQFHAYAMYDAALACYQRASLLAADEFRWFHLGVAVAAELGRPQVAIDLARRALELQPSAVPTHTLLGEVLLYDGQTDPARAEFERALELDPSATPALNGLAAIALRLGDLAEAVTLNARSLDLEPEQGQQHYAMAQALVRLGRIAEAEQHRREFERLGPSRPQRDPLLQEVQALRVGALYDVQAAQALAQAGDPAGAMQRLHRALASNPRLAVAHEEMGRLLNLTGRFAEAQVSLDQALALQPDSAEAHHQLTIALFSQGHNDEGLAHQRRAVELEPASADRHEQLATALSKAGLHDLAAAAYRQALAIDPGHLNAHENFAVLLVATGDVDQALVHLETVERAQPERPSVLEKLARLRMQQGKLDEGRQWLSRLLAVDPANRWAKQWIQQEDAPRR